MKDIPAARLGDPHETKYLTHHNDCTVCVSGAFAWAPQTTATQLVGDKQVSYFGSPVTNVQEALALSTQTSMVIKHYDADQAILHSFQVANNDGAWTIP